MASDFPLTVILSNVTDPLTAAACAGQLRV
jgi:hypothetical protein